MFLVFCCVVFFFVICFTQVVFGALLCVHRRAAGWNALQFPRAQRHLTVYCPRNRIANVNPLDLVNYKLQSIYCIYIYWYIRVKRHTEICTVRRRNMKLFWTTENAWTFAMDEKSFEPISQYNRNVYWTSVGVYMGVGVCVCVSVRVREHVFMRVRAWTVVGSMHMLNDLIDISPYCLVTFYNAWDATVDSRYICICICKAFNTNMP